MKTEPTVKLTQEQIEELFQLQKKEMLLDIEIKRKDIDLYEIKNEDANLWRRHIRVVTFANIIQSIILLLFVFAIFYLKQ